MFAKILICILALAVGAYGGFAAKNTEQRLRQHLLANYDPMVRPVKNYTTKMQLKHGLVIINIQNFLSDKPRMNAWANQGWKDAFLAWNPADWDNIASVRMMANEIWTPDTILYSALCKHRSAKADIATPVVVYNDGTVTFITVEKWTTANCTRLSDNKPAKTALVECVFKLGSWTYNGNEVDLQKGKLDTSFLVKSDKYEFKSATVERHVRYYECCPEPYPTLTYKVKIDAKEE